MSTMPGGGQVAAGKIKLDTGDMERAKASVRQSIQSMKQGFTGLAKSLQEVGKLSLNARQIERDAWMARRAATGVTEDLEDLRAVFQILDRQEMRLEINAQGIAQAKNQVAQALAEIKGGAAGMGQALTGAAAMGRQALQAVGQQVQSVGQSLQNFATSGVALAAGAFTGLGIAAATSMEQLEGKIELFGGDLEEVRAIADKLGMPFLQAAEAAAMLLPAIRRYGAELEDVESVTQRLAFMDPAQGTEGAGLAIREFLGGDYNSLVMRFEMSRSRLKEIYEATAGDAQASIEALSAYMDELGLTQEAMAGMADSAAMSFAGLKSDIQQTLAQAFTPMLEDAIKPMIAGLRDFLVELRETNPELLNIIAAVAGLTSGVAALSAAMGPVISMLGAIIANPVSLAVAVGAVATMAIAADNAQRQGITMGQSMAQIATVLLEAVRQVGNVIIEAYETWTHIRGLLEVGVNRLLNELGNALAGLIEGINGFLASVGFQEIGGRSPDGSNTVVDGLRSWGMSQEQAGVYMAGMQQGVDDLRGGWNTMIQDVQRAIVDAAFGAEEAVGRAAEAANEALAGSGAEGPAFEVTEEMLGEYQDFQDDMAAIEAEAQEKREQALADHEQRKTEKEADFQLRRERAVEDAQRAADQRVRDHAQKLADYRAGAEQEAAEATAKHLKDRAEKERDYRQSVAEMDAEHAATVAELRQDAQAEAVERERDHARKLEDLARDRNNSIRDAYASLDAVALQAAFDTFNQRSAEEEESYAEANRTAQNQLQERLADQEAQYQQQRAQEQRRFQEEMAQEEAQYQQRMAARRAEADARLAEMQVTFDREQAQRAAETAFKLQRMDEDHAREMARLDAAQQAKLQQIDAQARQEVAARQAAFDRYWSQALAEQGDHVAAMLQIEAEGHRAGVEEARRYIENRRRVLAQESALTQQAFGALANGARQMIASFTQSIPQITGVIRGIFNTVQSALPGVARTLQGLASGIMGNILGSRQEGGPIDQTGLYHLHAGEYVLDPETVRALLVGPQMAMNTAPAGVPGGLAARAGDTIGQIVRDNAITIQLPNVTDRTKAEDFERLLLETFEGVGRG